MNKVPPHSDQTTLRKVPPHLALFPPHSIDLLSRDVGPPNNTIVCLSQPQTI